MYFEGLIRICKTCVQVRHITHFNFMVLSFPGNGHVCRLFKILRNVAKNSLQKVSSPFVGECQLCILWWRSVGPDLAIFHHFRKKRFKLSVNFECFWRAWENIEPPLFAIGHIFIAVIGPILKNNLSIGRSHWWRWRRSLHRRKLQNSLL